MARKSHLNQFDWFSWWSISKKRDLKTNFKYTHARDVESCTILSVYICSLLLLHLPIRVSIIHFMSVILFTSTIAYKIFTHFITQWLWRDLCRVVFYLISMLLCLILTLLSITLEPRLLYTRLIKIIIVLKNKYCITHSASKPSKHISPSPISLCALFAYTQYTPAWSLHSTSAASLRIVVCWALHAKPHVGFDNKSINCICICTIISPQHIFRMEFDIRERVRACVCLCGVWIYDLSCLFVVH